MKDLCVRIELWGGERERERESYGDGGKARAKRMRVSFVPVVVEHK